jgi:pimeloyl-ACP methyl ester carboxylesterase
VQARRGRDARLQVIPRIEELMRGPRSLEAYRLARQIERDAPDEVALLRRGWLTLFVSTNPEGATVEFKNYPDVDGPWETLGTTPVRGVRVPFSYYRYRISKPGFVTREIASLLVPETIELLPESATPPGMVPVRGGPFSYLGAGQTVLPDYWLDKYEVTNREFKAFVAAGGYRDPKYWKEAFVDKGRTLSFDEAMARFRDATGRTGPSTWELGNIPEGQEDFPVSGISWFEASAFAAFTGKSLPTLFHWFHAAGLDGTSSEILQFSNFSGKQVERVGTRPGLTPPGAFDMAGNVKEWCVNAAEGGAKRYTLGGAWNEPSYRFAETDARQPWDRSPTLGVRLIKNLGPAADAERPVATAYPDPKTLVPVGDADFAAYARFYSYDRSPLDIRLEAVDDSVADYRKEMVSFAAAYGGERITATLFLPKNSKPPYQAIVLFPSAFARLAPSSRSLDFNSFDFLIKSGRALLYPVYQDTFERRRTPEGTGPNALRDRQVAWAKDFFRSVDYLATRSDIDMQRLGYYSLSMGAYFGPIPLALEPRIKVAVLLSGGLRYNYPPEIQPANFLPRVKIPVLTINGRDDFSASPAAQARVIELLGTPPEHKKHVALDGGHVPTDWRGTIREVLDWYDKYLGPVK